MPKELIQGTDFAGVESASSLSVEEYDLMSLDEESVARFRETIVNQMKGRIRFLIHPYYAYIEDNYSNLEPREDFPEDLPNSHRYLKILHRVLSANPPLIFLGEEEGKVKKTITQFREQYRCGGK